MKIIYGAQDIIDAQRVVDLLAFEQIQANVQGGYLSGAMGELPMSGLVNVWVADEDQARARLVLDAADHEPGLPDEPETDEAPAVVLPRGEGAGVLGFLGVLALGGVIGFVVAYGQLRLPHQAVEGDVNHNGILDVTHEYRGERLHRIVTDRNEDGQADEIVEDPRGTESSARYDDDFDGRFETYLWYRGYQPYASESDYDGDGHFEWRTDYRRGVVHTTTLSSPAGVVVKVLSFKGGVLAQERFDADGDGVMEILRRFDARGEQIP